ncbi:Cadmium-induced protein [Vigna angularis]|uniref:Cadmium-induced protein n=1 Tax=Phaseolus angularis TaxID=3914 RepID=A0A8T0LG12_PHAAN|nr:Cadmium-induced protein [Vigna angularis]
MIIKGLFRRYERWNPVHPTYGAFWGMGVGVGCGVGWGPGFGPEVIGYVGAGCGIGFNVGITFAGVGVGLPAHFVFVAPYNGKSLLLSEGIDCYLKVSLIQFMFWVSWMRNLPCISDLQREASGKLFEFRQRHLSIKGIDFFDTKKNLSLITSSARRSMQTFHNQLFCSHKERRSLTLNEGDSSQKVRESFLAVIQF